MATGSRRVATKVVAMAICEVSPVRQMVAICAKRNEPAAA